MQMQFDPETVWGWLQIITAGAALVSALAALLSRWRIQQLKIEINSRMSELLELTKTSAHAAGMEDARIAREAENREREHRGSKGLAR
jgi:hypothetical protein